MSNRPDKEWREKGLSLAVWGEGESAKYQLQKSFKRKGSEEWERQTIRLFSNELENLGGLVMKAVDYQNRHLSEASEPPLAAVPMHHRDVVVPITFDDDDIPF